MAMYRSWCWEMAVQTPLPGKLSTASLDQGNHNSKRDRILILSIKFNQHLRKSLT
jgi:hypothetical protein